MDFRGVVAEVRGKRREVGRMRFRDRRHAGRELAKRVRALVPGQTGAEPIVLALPRGGVVVAAEVADELGAPLDILTVRKIGLPGDPEFGIGAIAGEDPAVFDMETLARFGLSEADLIDDVERERAELRRREHVYRGSRPEPPVHGRTCISLTTAWPPASPREPRCGGCAVVSRPRSSWRCRGVPAARARPCSPRGRPRGVRAPAVRCSMRWAWWYDDFGQVD